jgi:histone H3/H4
LAALLLPDLSRDYEETASQLFQSAVTSTMHSKRKTLSELQVPILRHVYLHTTRQGKN